MKRTRRLKRYLYNRDERQCFYCGKPLSFQQMTIDHVVPISRGGTDDVFNLVLCCRECNDAKGDRPTEGAEDLHVHLFKRAVRDGKIESSPDEEIVASVDHACREGDHTLFESKSHRMQVRDDRVTKITYLDRKGFE